MAETAKQLKVRLKDEGRWGVYVKVREWYKRQGFPAKDAKQEAEVLFPPVPDQFSNRLKAYFALDKVTDNQPVCDATMADFSDKNSVTASKSIEWVMEHVRIKDVTPANCPDGKTWTLLQEARGNPDFRRDLQLKLWPRVLQKQEEGDSKFDDDGREHFELIEEIRSKNTDERDALLPSGTEGS